MGDYKKMIDYNVVIEFMEKLPEDYIDLLKEAEQWDEEGNIHMYIECANSIDIGAKLLCMNGYINEQQWDILNRRYKWW